MLTALVIAAVLVVLLIAAVAATHEGDVLLDAPADAADVGLPAVMVQPEDIAQVRFGMTLRGYRMAEVDHVLERLSQELAERDSQIVRLQTSLAHAERPLEETEPRASVPSYRLPAPHNPAPEVVSWSPNPADDTPVVTASAVGDPTPQPTQPVPIAPVEPPRPVAPPVPVAPPAPVEPPRPLAPPEPVEPLAPVEARLPDVALSPPARLEPTEPTEPIVPVPVDTAPVTLPIPAEPEPVALPANSPEPVALPAEPEPVSLPAGSPEPVALPAGSPEPVALPAGSPEPVALPAEPEPVALPAGSPEPVGPSSPVTPQPTLADEAVITPATPVHPPPTSVFADDGFPEVLTPENAPAALPEAQEPQAEQAGWHAFPPDVPSAPPVQAQPGGGDGPGA